MIQNRGLAIKLDEVMKTALRKKEPAYVAKLHHLQSELPRKQISVTQWLANFDCPGNKLTLKRVFMYLSQFAKPGRQHRIKQWK